MRTDIKYSPHDLLPCPEPKTYEPKDTEFYDDVAKHLIKDTVRIMANGLHIDLDKVENLEETLDDILVDVEKQLAENPIIKEFQEKQHKRLMEEFIKDKKSKMKDKSEFLKPFKYNDMIHRSYFMHIWAQRQNISEPSDLLPTGVPKWDARLCKKFPDPIIKKLLDGQLDDNNPIVKEAMDKLSQDKADMYNNKFVEAISNTKINVEFPKFNPASSKQKQELFEWLDIPSDKKSKTTGLPSYDRAEIERINKETTDENIKNFTQNFIDHSFAAIVRNNFIEAFYKYTIQDRLYGTYKLLGAKSGRYTSQNPNMLNMPSTGSKFAKPIKKCFTAPEGTVILTADYAALEDRVIASLTRDTNKCAIFTEGLDGHSLNALGYFRDQASTQFELTGDTNTDVKKFKELVDEGNKVLKELRQKGKGPTFGLAYGAFPPKVAATLKIPLEEAKDIFDNYHNVLYSGITDYRENYVLPTAFDNGRIHLGMGFYLYTDNADRDIRTLNNATCQFWSILTALTINKMHQLIDEAGLQNDVIVISTIYDSIYFQVTEDPKIIKWVKDNLINCMVTDFMDGQEIKNEAESEIGYDWADLHLIPNNASIEEITKVLSTMERT